MLNNAMGNPAGPGRSGPSADYLREDRIIDEKTVSALTGMSLGALRKWRYARQGPPWVRVGLKSVRYPVRGLQEWLRSLESAGVK